MPFRELDFADHNRIDMYYSQIAAEARPALSFHGNVGSATSVNPSPHAEEIDLLSKIDDVRAYLIDKNLIAFTRPTEQDRLDLRLPSRDGLEPSGALFREETLELHSVHISPQKDSVLLASGLSLWIAQQAEPHYLDPDVLVLIKNFPLPDEASARYISGYSLLSMDAESRGLSAVDGIGANPVNALRHFGAHVGPPRRRTVLYRVRVTFAEAERDYSITTVGYPLAIWRAS